MPVAPHDIDGDGVADPYVGGATPIPINDQPADTYFRYVLVTAGAATVLAPDRPGRKAITIINFHTASAVYVGRAADMGATNGDGRFPLAAIPNGGVMGGDLRSTRSKSAFWGRLPAGQPDGYVYVIEVY